LRHQEDGEFKVSLGYIAIPSLKKKKAMRKDLWIGLGNKQFGPQTSWYNIWLSFFFES
jgi:hypothetical protein